MQGAYHQHASIDSRLTISHTRLPYLLSRWVGPGCPITHLIELNNGFFMQGLVLALWRVGCIPGNGCGIKGQNYVVMYQGSEI